MPLGGWSCDELAEVFGLSNGSKATQAFNPAVFKVATAMLADSRKTIRAINEAMELIVPTPLDPVEYRRLINMKNGRLDRSVLHPGR